MPLIIRQIADAARQREYQNARALGYSWGEAVHAGWLVEIEVLELGRAGILEGKR